MLKAKDVKRVAKKCGADLVGIASMDRFEGAPKEFDPRYIFPDAKALIALGFRIPRGYFRGIEEGTDFANYPALGYASINLVYAPVVLREVCCFIEDHGYEAAPAQAMLVAPSRDSTKGITKTSIKPVSPDKPSPNVLIHYRLAAVAAGLGEIGYSKVLLTPEFGPRQRISGFILTDAPLKPDPLFKGKICDRCMMCVKACPGQAISRDKTVKITLAGKKVEWGDLDVDRCSLAYMGGIDTPFTPDDFDFEEEVKKIKTGKGTLGEAFKKLPHNAEYVRLFHHYGAIGGARGCIRACMIHLEETGRIKSKFHNRFRKREPWFLSKLSHP